MRDIHQIRRDNLRRLLEKKYKGDRRALQDALEIGQVNFLSRLLSERPGTGKNIGSRLARRIEQAAGKPLNWLDADHSRSAIREPAADYGTARLVPLLEWPDLSGWVRAEQKDELLRRRSLVPCPLTCGPDTFALRVLGASMEPRFRENDIIYCDPAAPVKSGSFIIVQRNSNTDQIFRQLTIEGRRHFLKALNPHWPDPIEPLLDNDVILGVVIFRGEEI